MKLTTFLLAFAFIAALQITALSQVGPRMEHIKTPSGLTLIAGSPGDNFRMQIRGQNVSRLKTPKRYWYEADRVPFEFFSEDNSAFAMTDVPFALPERTILELYRSEFLRRNAAEHPKLRSSWITLANGKKALTFTSARRQAASEPAVEKQMYILLATPARVYGLLAPIKNGQTNAAVRTVLIRTLGSLIFTDDSKSR